MRPQLPVLAVLAAVAVAPGAAAAEAPPATTGQAADAAVPATPDPAAGSALAPTTESAPPAAEPVPSGPPASTTTTPAAPAVPAPGVTAGGLPAVEDQPSSDGKTRTDRRREENRAERRRRARAEERRERAERRKDRDDEDRSGATTPDDDRDDDEQTAADVLDAPATGLSALSVARFRIPPFLLPIYQAAGVQYGIRWELLAAINEIETDYGRNLNVSSAGARGWMQFMPATWKTYGVDANGDGKADPYNPVDAIFAAARYLKAAGGTTDVRRAVFAYNHANWYVDDVLRRARAISGLPADVVSSLTGLTLAQLPVHVRGTDAGGDRATERGAKRSAKARDGLTLRATGADRWGRIGAPEGSDVVAIQDATVTRIGDGPSLGRFVELRDAYGNRYKYAHLGTLATRHLVAKPKADDEDDHDHGHGADEHGADETEATAAGEQAVGAEDPVPTAPATAGTRSAAEKAPTRRSTPSGDAAPVTAGSSPVVAGPARPLTVLDGAAGARGAGGAADDSGLAGAPTPTAPVTTTAPAPVPAAPATEAPAAAAPQTPAAVAAGTPEGAAPASTGEATPTTATPVVGGTAATDAAIPVVPTVAPGTTLAEAQVPAAPGAPGSTSPFASPVAGFLPPGVLSTPGTETGAPVTVVAASGLLGRALATPTVPAWRLLVPEIAPKPTTAPRERDAGSAEGDRVDDLDRWIVRAGGLRRKDVRLKPLRKGSKVLAGSILGTTGSTALRLAIRPAGDGSPRIDPKPIVAGWRLLDDASVFGHDDRSELVADRGDRPDVGRLLLMSKAQLQARVLADPKLSIYEAGRNDIRTGAIDRRVLATMAYLSANDLRLTITSLKTGHSYLSKSGNVSAHSYGAAMDIAAVNGATIAPGTQGKGSITESTIRLLLKLQGTVRPNQIISLMTFPGTDNTLAMGDHDDHIHVGFPREAIDGDATLGKQVRAVLAPSQWGDLVDRLKEIDNPTVRRGVSDDATKPRKGGGAGE